MRFTSTLCATVATIAVASLAAMPQPAAAQSKARKQQVQKTAEIPHCVKNLGTIAVAEPHENWWSGLNLGSPEAIIKVFVMKSGCFGLVDRGRGLAARNTEAALAQSGALQRGSNVGNAQVRTADYTIIPDLVTRNANSGGGGFGGLVGGLLGGRTGAVLGGAVSVKKKEANVTLTLVNNRTTVMERLTEGFAKKSDIGFGGGGALFSGGLFGAGGSSYENTDIGQVIVLAYLDAYTNMVRELGGLPEDPSAAAPQAE